MKLEKTLLTCALISVSSLGVNAGIVAVPKDASLQKKESDEKIDKVHDEVWNACVKLVRSFEECKTLPQNCSRTGANILDTSYEYIKECLNRVHYSDNTSKGCKQLSTQTITLDVSSPAKRSNIYEKILQKYLTIQGLTNIKTNCETQSVTREDGKYFCEDEENDCIYEISYNQTDYDYEQQIRTYEITGESR